MNIEIREYELTPFSAFNTEVTYAAGFFMKFSLDGETFYASKEFAKHELGAIENLEILTDSYHAYKKGLTPHFIGYVAKWKGHGFADFVHIYEETDWMLRWDMIL